MATILDVQENIKSLKVKDIAVDAIDKTLEVAVALNVEQLASGKNSDGTKIKPSYSSKKYAQLKANKNPKPGMWTPDLILTGAFTESFKIDISGDNLKYSSTDSKAPELSKKYGDDIFGLTENSNEYYAQSVVFPVMMDTINQMTGL